jgi:hypothetical protein
VLKGVPLFERRCKAVHFVYATAPPLARAVNASPYSLGGAAAICLWLKIHCQEKSASHWSPKDDRHE